LWHVQTGNLLVWGYQGEGFEWLNPNLIKFLFSVRKGAFFYHPVLLVVLISSSVGCFIRKDQTRMLYSLLAFAIICYVLSSWHNWYYGASYGSRPLIDFYVFFTVLLVYAIPWWKTLSPLIKGVLFIFTLAACTWNVIGVYQYQHFIQDWQKMTWEKFKVIGLNTAEHYQGIWSSYQPDRAEYEIVFQAPVDLKLQLDTGEVVYSQPWLLDSIFTENEIKHAVITGDFMCEKGSSKVILIADDPRGNNILWASQRVISSAHKNDSNSYMQFYFELPKNFNGDKMLISIDAHEPLKIRDVELRLEAKR
jgi:hypothetical protein